MYHIMVDLETLGQTPGCAILSIGAIQFFPQGGNYALAENGFYSVVNTDDCAEHYLAIEPGTVAWWDRQSEEAQQVRQLARDPKSSVPLKLALEGFNNYLLTIGGKREVCIWGNGADFDNGILQVAYKMAGMEPAWEFWNNRCYRTFKNLCPGPKLERIGTYHNALDDARSQALHLVEVAKQHPSLRW